MNFFDAPARMDDAALVCHQPSATAQASLSFAIWHATYGKIHPL